MQQIAGFSVVPIPKIFDDFRWNISRRSQRGEDLVVWVDLISQPGDPEKYPQAEGQDQQASQPESICPSRYSDLFCC